MPVFIAARLPQKPELAATDPVLQPGGEPSTWFPAGHLAQCVQLSFVVPKICEFCPQLKGNKGGQQFLLCS